MSNDTGFCHECNRVTVWRGEVCTGCGRVWGHESVEQESS